MSTKLFLTETEARSLPLAGTQAKLSELIDDYGGAGVDGWLDATTTIDEVLLAPAPIDCELPRGSRHRAVGVWGYARSSLVGYGHRVAAISTEVGIEPKDSAAQMPGIDTALHMEGTVWTSRPLQGGIGPLAGEFWRAAQPSADAQSQVLNLRLLTATRSREQLRALEAASDGYRARTSSAGVPKTPATWGRVIFINDPDETPEEIPADAFREIVLDLAGGPFDVRAHVARRRMSGADAAYLVVVVCGGPFEERDALRINALLRRSLQHSLANDWLTTRAEQVNDRQAQSMAELLDRGTSAARVEDLRQHLGLLRYAFVDELEFAWDFDVDRQAHAEDLYRSIDRATRLTHRWRRELTRFERLVSVADVAYSSGFAQSRPHIDIPEVIPGFGEETNLFSQIKLWWEHRRDGDENAPKTPALQRPGMRRKGKVPRGARMIELHPFRNRPALFSELSASIALTSFMTAASAVFLGVVLQRGVNSALPMDVLFLFIATFGFLFATLIYANASGRLARHGTFGYETQVEIANRVSEYLGVFPLLLAIPLSVSRFLKTGPIPWTVAGLALLATLAYHYLNGASLLERDISNDRIGSDRQRKLIFVPALAGLMTVTLLGQLLGVDAMEIGGAAGFGLLSVLMVLLSSMLPERTNPQEYLVDEWDLLSEETPSIPVDPAEIAQRPARHDV